MERKQEIKYLKYDSLECANPEDRALIEAAISATQRSIAPYSNFRVGAAARLRSGEVVYGANVESEVYPAGICAERNLLFAAATQHPDDPIVALAVASASSDQECTPCGFCRQSLLDTERRQGSPIRVLMCSDTSATVVHGAESLLPFSFALQR